MRYVAAYLLATLGGNATPSADDIKAILASVGIDADADKLNKVGGISFASLPSQSFALPELIVDTVVVHLSFISWFGVLNEETCISFLSNSYRIVPVFD